MFLGSRLNVPIGKSGAGRSQDRFRRSPVDPELFNELIKRYAVSQPVKELLHRKSAATKARSPAHAVWIDPHCFLESHHVFHLNRAGWGSEHEYRISIRRQAMSVPCRLHGPAEVRNLLYCVADGASWHRKPPPNSPGTG